MTLEPTNLELAFMYIPVNNRKNAENKFFLGHNICNVLSYFPLVGTISGIVRIILAAIAYRSTNDENFKRMCKYDARRGLIEMLPFTSLPLLGADMINSIKFKTLPGIKNGLKLS